MIENYQNYREKKMHGDMKFPFNIYSCIIPDSFPEMMLHWHEEMEIIYIRKGSGRVTVDLESRIVTAPAVVFVFPGQLHGIYAVDSARMEYKNFIFHPRFLYSGDEMLCDCEFFDVVMEGRGLMPPFVTAEDPKLVLLTEPLEASNRIAQEGDILSEKDAAEKTAAALFIKSQLYLLFYRLQRYFFRDIETDSRDRNLEWVKPVLLFVKENYTDRILVADAAAKVDFSQAHFMRLFKQTMGVSFGTFLKEYRLAKAEEMLRTTNESVLDVAQDSGFQNFSYFIRAFKKRYGKTPLKYREYQRR